ncbi:MAG: hypothetical protein L0206_20035, partial [Actinobacteria bacterium]|nr:hypothetical protein [Actinomycetota bacterium]
MDDVLGILLLAGYIVAILAISAAVTFAVVKIFPTERNPKKSDKPDEPEPPSTGNGSEGGAGRLFRKAKR